MNYLALVIGLIKLALAVNDWLRQRGLITNAQNEIVAKLLVEQSYEIDQGKAARLKQRELDSHGVPDDDNDPFRRD